MDNLADISDQQASYYINKLKSFLGPTNIDHALRHYERLRGTTGPITWQYYLKSRHPWLGSLRRIAELQNTGKSIRRNLTHGIKQLVADGKRIDVLRHHMTAATQNKYRRDLLDFDGARSFLFELRIAWHFLLKGYEPRWHDDDSRPHSEFILGTPQCDVDVECKTISVDICRQVHRRDFYQLADALVARVGELGYAGRIDIVLAERLNGHHIDALPLHIAQSIRDGSEKGVYETEGGEFTLNLRKPRSGVVNLQQEYSEFRESLPEWTHGVMACPDQKGERDPLKITLKSKQPDRVLNGIYKKLKRAMSNQLNRSMPGLVICFLEGVEDLRALAKDSGLQLATSKLLRKDELSHVAGVGYSSEPWMHRHEGYEEYNNQALYFRNHNCRFIEARDFDYMIGQGWPYDTSHGH